MKRRTLYAAALAAILAGAPVAVLAGDPPRAPAVAPDLDKSLSSAHALVEDERWADGEAALRRIFTDFPNDARVRSKLREIEDELKLCVFRKSLPPPKGTDFFGAAAKRFVPSTREIELEFSRAQGPLWESIEGGFAILNVRLDGSLTVEADLAYVDSARRTAVFLLCYDLEKRGGYMVTPGCYIRSETSTLTAPAKIVKITAGEDKELANEVPYGADFIHPLTISRTGGAIVVKVGTATIARAGDNMYSSGYFGVNAGGLHSLTIKGRVDKHAWRKMVGERYAKELAGWEASSWNREREIPAWARETVVAAPDATLAEFPSDAPDGERRRLRATVESLTDGDLVEAATALMTAETMPPHTALYLRGLAELALGRWKDAEAALDQLNAAEPEFVPARLFRGIALIGLRRLPEARAELDWARAKRPRAVDAVVASAQLAVLEGDLPRAGAVLEKAADVAGGDPRLDEVRDWVHRCTKGPRLAQRFERQSEHFVVVSDHSEKVCYDTATLLESMQGRYAEAVGAAKGSLPRARVYVFSGHQGYMDYAAGLHARADSTAGVYLPMLRELAIWIPLDMTSFTDTVRHEGFHQYLHRLVDDPPIWFNEGYASVLGGGGPEGLRNAERDEEYVKQFVPVRRLVAMRQPEFMSIANVTYTESRYLVAFLRATKNEKLRRVLREYFAAVADGLSQDQANAKVLDPVMDLLESEFRRSY